VIEITLKELAKVVEGEVLTKDQIGDKLIRGISIDSREIREGNLFVAVPGERFDGHRFVGEAVLRGAQAVVVSKEKWQKEEPGNLKGAAVVLVGDTKKALGDLASWYKGRFEIPTVAVTGTNGKTTTKEMIAEVLSAVFKVVKSPRSFNNLIGVPLTLFRLNPGTEALVLELGMSQLGEIGTLTKMARPEIGVITNIGPAHLEYMQSVERIAQAKFELPENMPSPKTLVLNADDPFLANRIREKRGDEKVITFGIKSQADFRGDQIEVRQDGCISFRVNGDLTVDLLLLGRHSVYNALAAIAVGSLLGVDMPKAKKKLERYTPSDLRMQLVYIKDITVINDSYNANPVSMAKALESLQEIQTGGRKVAVLADMLELGEKAALFHREVGKKAAELGIDLLLTVGELARQIAQGAREGGMNPNGVREFENNQQAGHYLLETLEAGDWVLVKGSRRMKTEEVVVTLKSLYGRQN
jgi:UDP-N-acetylmuramoyl-tripeptide--D-alanyl-D-alanine ligase